MSERRRQRITVEPREILPTAPGGIEDAPNDGMRYVRQSGAWAINPTPVTAWGTIVGTLSAQTDLQAALDAKPDAWETGTAYLDGSSGLYIVYGTTDDWEATRTLSTGTTSTGTGQAGAPPTTLAALKLLTYS